MATQKPGGAKRRVSHPGAPVIFTMGARSKLTDILTRPNIHIDYSIQHSLEAKAAENNVQIHTNAMGGCKLKIATLPHHGGEDMQRREVFGREYDR